MRDIIELDDGYAVVELYDVQEGELTPEDEMKRRAYERRIAAASATDVTITISGQTHTGIFILPRHLNLF